MFRTRLVSRQLHVLEATGDRFQKSLGFAEIPEDQKQVDLLHCTAIYASEGDNKNRDYFLRQVMIAARKTPIFKFVDFEHKPKVGGYFQGERIGICGHIYDAVLMLEKGKEQIFVEEEKIHEKDVNGKKVYTLDYENADQYRLHLVVAFVLYAWEFPALAEEVKKSVSGESKNELSVSMEVLFSEYKYRVGEISPLESFTSTASGQDYYKGNPLAPMLNTLRESKKEYQGKPVYRVIGGEVLFSGMGIVFFPANNYSEILSVADPEGEIKRLCTPVTDKQGQVTMQCVVSSVAKIQEQFFTLFEKTLKNEIEDYYRSGALEVKNKIPEIPEESDTSLQNLLLLYHESSAQKKGIVFIVGFPKDGGGSEVQSVLFDKTMWTAEEARKWLKAHKYHSGKIDVTDQYLRFRQNDPGKYKRLRTTKAERNDLLELFKELAAEVKV